MRRRLVATMVVLVLSAGIGTATALFSVVDGALLRPLPWPSAHRLVRIHAVLPDRRADPAYAPTWDRAPLSWSAWEALQGTRAFDAVGAWYASDFYLRHAGRGEVVRGVHVSSSLLSLLEAKAREGRLFSVESDRSEADDVVLSHQAWVRWFGGRPGVVGSTVSLAASPSSPSRLRTVIGVLPPEFRFPGESPDVLLPMGLMAWNASFETNRFTRAIGLLAPGVSPKAAHAVAEPLVRGPEPPERRTARLVPLREDLAGPAAPLLWLALGGAGLLLFVASATAAALLLNEGRARRHEFGVRISTGATRQHLLRQVAAEHVVLAVVASIGGLVLAGWLTPSLVSLAPPGLSGLDGIRVNVRAAAFALAVAAIATLAFGLAPAATIAATNVTEVLSQSSSQIRTAGRVWHRAIVGSALALAIVLLVGATLLGESLLRLQQTHLGFNPTDVIVVSVKVTQAPPASVVPGDRSGRLNGTFDRETIDRIRSESSHHRLQGWMHTDGVLERLAALPGVSVVAGSSNVPFDESPVPARVRTEGQAESEGVIARRQVVTERYFEAVGIPLVRGRIFERHDRTGAAAAVVSESFERQLLSPAPGIRRFLHGTRIYEVIGVVADVKDDPGRRSSSVFYVLNQTVDSVRHLLIRTSGPTPGSAIPALRQVIESHDPLLAVTATKTMNGIVDNAMSEERFSATVTIAFAAMAVVLVAVGLSAVAAHAVVDRSREIAIRMALGAAPADVRSLMFREMCGTIGAGLAAGMLLARVASHGIRAQLFEVSPAAPQAFLAAVAILAGAAAVATLGPAFRAGRIDPMQVLRE